MTKHQAENCLTLAYWLSDCMSDDAFRLFWNAPSTAVGQHPSFFHGAKAGEIVSLVSLFGAPAWFVLSGRLTDGLGIPKSRVTRCAIATALVHVVDIAGWEDADVR